jgi:DNA-binding NarL/FixJ family response regulator
MSEEPPASVAAETVEDHDGGTDSTPPAADPVTEADPVAPPAADEDASEAAPTETPAVAEAEPAVEAQAPEATPPAKPGPPPPPPKPGLLVVATAQETREQFRAVFSSDPGFVVIDAVVPADAGQAVTAHTPRVVLIVVEGRDEEFAALRDSARAAQGATRVIALSRPNIDPIHVLRAAEEGAHGHWTTAVGVRNLPIWIRQAAAGTVRMEDRIREVRGLSDAGPRSRRSLRWQHLAALQLLARGSSNAQEIAWKLGIPRDKAHTLVEQACRCMEAQTPGEAVQTALSQGLIRS